MPMVVGQLAGLWLPLPNGARVPSRKPGHRWSMHSTSPLWDPIINKLFVVLRKHFADTIAGIVAGPSVSCSSQN
jgi:hypothetical protein